LVASCRFQQFWLEADAADLKSADGSRRETWRMCESASYELIEYAEENGLDEQRKKIEPPPADLVYVSHNKCWPTISVRCPGQSE
jgi:hypothetical protein